MSVVTFEIIPAIENKKIALAKLNAPQSLNALSFEMIELLIPQLEAWQKDENIAAVVLTGTGDKAFCAGGDVVSLYHYMQSNPEQLSDEHIKSSKLASFFSQEYLLDQLIHEYRKPFLVWGNGYIMGGGIGLFAGASHRVVTENSLLAMPEVTIGLYPDVGASWFLNKMPANTGLFLGITGAIFNAVDAKYIGLADHLIIEQQFDEILSQLALVSWQLSKEDHLILDNLLSKHSELTNEKRNALVNNISNNIEYIEQVTSFDGAEGVFNAISSIEMEDAWCKHAQKKLKQGSPLSAALIYQQLERSKSYSLTECFASELNLTLKCCQYSEFSEGVRSLLVDKDKQPKWAFNEINKIDTTLLNWFFAPIFN